MRSAEYSQLANLKWTLAMLAATFTVGVGMYLIEQGRMTEVVFYATGIASSSPHRRILRRSADRSPAEQSTFSGEVPCRPRHFRRRRPDTLAAEAPRVKRLRQASKKSLWISRPVQELIVLGLGIGGCGD
jgi:hypothetical protein